MTTNLMTSRLQELEQSDAATLRRVWLEIKDSEPPKTFTGRLMRLALAWDVQMAVAGSEPSKTRRDWNRIIKEKVKSASAELVGSTLPPAVCIGTRLLKDWGGTTHEVLVTEGGAT